MAANVWKVLGRAGQRVRAGEALAVLEAMKMEVAVLVDARLDGAEVAAVLVRPGDCVDGGQAVALLRRAGGGAALDRGVKAAGEARVGDGDAHAAAEA